MIVDSHVHLVVPGFLRSKFVLAHARAGNYIYNKLNKTNLTIDEYIGLTREKVDPDGSKLIETMDQAGIDKSVVFGVDWGYAVTGEPRVPNREQNRFHADLAKKYPGRIIVLAALDPRRPDVMEQATQAIEEWGMRGFYFMPPSGFRPDDPVCFPIYERCIDWGVPMIIHSGKEIAHWDYNHPVVIATAALRYPELKVVIGHAGTRIYRREALEAATVPNVYLDFSEYQGYWHLHPDRFYQWLREFPSHRN